MKLAGMRLRQRDGVTCGPTVAVVAGALIDPERRAALTRPLSGAEWFSTEQARVHADINRVWPRRLGTTPSGMARALTTPKARYHWRICRGRCDPLTDVLRAVADGWPVAMLIGRFIPRHWVLVVETDGAQLQCYEPSSGEVRTVPVADVRRGRLTRLGYPRPFVFTFPNSNV